MPEQTQFVVPQFLDVESKIIGPITGRQFAILLGVLLFEFIIYRVFLNLLAILGLGIPVLVVGIVFAFAKVNGQPFHYIALNMIQTLRRPGFRVWDKSQTDAEIKARIMKEEEPLPPAPKLKAPLERSRLSEMSLVVNTGGVYTPESEQWAEADRL
ncbi:MAG: PrgI family protein [Candidatus Uhrbacteria bacterium]|nr:PrgI family protein [Candidatus Uhrbacteria bacterium]